jgi:hypothetical protein
MALRGTRGQRPLFDLWRVSQLIRIATAWQRCARGGSGGRCSSLLAPPTRFCCQTPPEAERQGQLALRHAQSFTAEGPKPSRNWLQDSGSDGRRQAVPGFHECRQLGYLPRQKRLAIHQGSCRTAATLAESASTHCLRSPDGISGNRWSIWLVRPIWVRFRSAKAGWPAAFFLARPTSLGTGGRSPPGEGLCMGLTGSLRLQRSSENAWPDLGNAGAGDV